MVTKGIYLFWDKKYEQVIYAGRFTGRQRIKAHFYPSMKYGQPINKYVQNHPDRIESVIFCEFDDISDDDLNQLEMETIKLFKLNRYKYPDSHVFNFTDGGDGISGFIHSEESKNKISKNHPDYSGENHPMYGKKRPGHSKRMSGKNHPNYGNPRNYHPSPQTKQKMSEAVSGENNPRAKYTLWDITKCHYFKVDMFRNNNVGMNPRRCFASKYNGEKLSIGNHLDFYTPELINDLINEFLEVN